MKINSEYNILRRRGEDGREFAKRSEVFERKKEVPLKRSEFFERKKEVPLKRSEVAMKME